MSCDSKLVCIMAAVMVTLALCSCPATLGPGPALEGCPVAGITLPAGSVSEQPLVSRLNWGVDFTNDAAQDAVMAYMAGQLKSKGFKEDMSYRDTPGTLKMRSFDSSAWTASIMTLGEDKFSLRFASLKD